MLQLAHFLQAGQDYEQAQYAILHELQQLKQDFAHTRLYPHLGALINLHSSLQHLVDGFEKHRAPGPIERIDLEAQRIVYGQPDPSPKDLAQIEALIHWALPHLQAAIEEGRTLFEFVDEHLHLEAVGLIPSYLEEGYLLVPDRRAGQLHVLQYSLSLFTDAQERYRSLRTTHLYQVPMMALDAAPTSVKQRLLHDHPDWPNPATYYCEAEIDFPFDPTVLPITKRKLMRLLTQQGLA